VLNTPLIEMICSANLSFGLMPGLTHGAYSALHEFGTDELKKTYLPKMVSGEWTGVMCLTEPQAGTDLGLINTTATPNDDGSYDISGGKIFISCGEHSAAENIIHLILARLPDAPEGVKGISLFVAPKFMVNADGSLGNRNKINCEGIEHKMGIHASPTCVMNYDKAKSWLVGEPNKGLRAMFKMMNEARILVGLQGLGIGEVSYQNALAYAKDRPQGRALKGAKFPNKKADPITVHPDVRRMLLTQRSFTEGGRVLALWAALNIDITKNHPDAKTREEADDFVQLITPIVKAYLTDGGTETANIGMQILGGYGYIKEYGMEQYARDCRITQIYEGTNSIQALDLVGRKLPKHTGRYLRRLMHPISKFIEENKGDETMAEFTKPLYMSFKSLQNSSLWIAQKSISNPNEAAGAANDYLRLMSLVVIGYIWAKSAKIALAKLNPTPNMLSYGEHSDSTGSIDSAQDSGKPSQNEEVVDREFYEAKITTARFFLNKILPEHYSLLAKITAGVKNLEIADLDY